MKIDEGLVQSVGSFHPRSAVEQTRPSPSPTITANKPAKPAPPQPETDTQKIEKAELEAAVDAINSQLQLDQRSIEFRVEDETDKIVVSITNEETGELIRQIPAEVALKLAENLDDLNGSLVSSYG